MFVNLITDTRWERLTLPDYSLRVDLTVVKQAKRMKLLDQFYQSSLSSEQQRNICNIVISVVSVIWLCYLHHLC